MKAMILAAGEGTRLRPLTDHIPKVLVPLDGTPLLIYTISWLRSYDISELAINLCHLGGEIKGLLGDGSDYKVKITYSTEEVLLGTAGGVKKMEHFFTDTFLVVYGDLLTNFNLSAMIEFHREKEGIATVAVHNIQNMHSKGCAHLNDEYRITEFVEKPQKENIVADTLANAGVYILEPKIFEYIPDDTFSDFGYDVFPQLIASKEPIYGYILSPDEYLIDIGEWEQYQKINEDARKGRLKIPL
jgi:NDP-sugar pyrophosphorylase family protein